MPVEPQPRTLILGAAGWIGREVRRMGGDGVIGTSRRPDAASNGLIYVAGPADLQNVVQTSGITTLINCAGTTTGSEEAQRPANVELPRHVGRLCLRLGVRMVHLGSAAEYGDAGDAPVSEDTQPQPQSAYGRMKLAATSALLELAEQGLDVTVARPFNVIGPGQPVSTPIGEFAAAVKALPAEGGAVRVRDSSLVRDFLSRTLLAESLLQVAAEPMSPHLVNICSGQGHSFRDVILAMARVRGAQVHVEDTAPGGIPRMVGDPTVLHRLLGARQPEPLDELARQALQDESASTAQ